jgi:chemotaxis signal transduction protein
MLSVFDLAQIVGQSRGDAGAKRPSGQIVVMTLPDNTRFGLLVDDLGEIVEVLPSRLKPLPPMMTGHDAFADMVIACGDADDAALLVVLSAERLLHGLSVPTSSPGTAGRTGSGMQIARSA